MAAQSELDVTPDEPPPGLGKENEHEVRPGVIDGGLVEGGAGENVDELAGTRLLFHRDPVTGAYSENIILSPEPTRSPNGEDITNCHRFKSELDY